MWVGGAGGGGNVDAVRSWVASGADINVVNERGVTPLMEASFWHHAECVWRRCCDWVPMRVASATPA